MDVDSFYLAMSDNSLDEIVKPEMKQAYEADKKNWLAREKISKRTTGLFKPEYAGTRGVCGLVWSATLFKMRPDKINIAVKVFWKSIMIYIFRAIKISWDVFLKTRSNSELEGKDIDKAKNVRFRVYDQGIVTYEQNKFGFSLLITISVMSWPMAFI